MFDSDYDYDDYDDYDYGDYESITITMNMGRGRGRSRSRSRNLSGAWAGAGNFKNGRLRQPCFMVRSRGGVGGGVPAYTVYLLKNLNQKVFMQKCL